MAFGPDFAREMKADEDAQVTALLDLAFGGPDLKTAYLGCLLGDSIASFTMPVACMKA